MAIIAHAAFMSLLTVCAPSVHPQTMYSVVKTESRFNEFAIGVVGKPLARQPETMSEAIAMVNTLVKEGRNFSIGLGQINRANFDVTKPELMFDPCNNLKMAAQILGNCYEKFKEGSDSAQQGVLKAVSCYYSGNKERGFVPEPEFGNTSHVERVLASAETYKVGPLGNNEGQGPGSTLSEQNNPQLRAVYSTWDVLRQYPRYVPVSAPDTENQRPSGNAVKKETEVMDE